MIENIDKPAILAKQGMNLILDLGANIEVVQNIRLFN